MRPSIEKLSLIYLWAMVDKGLSCLAHATAHMRRSDYKWLTNSSSVSWAIQEELRTQ